MDQAESHENDDAHLSPQEIDELLATMARKSAGRILIGLEDSSVVDEEGRTRYPEKVDVSDKYL